MAAGDAKLSGRAIEVTDPEEIAAFRQHGVPPGPFHLFRLDLHDAVLTSVDGDELVIELWRAGSGVQRFVRR